MEYKQLQERLGPYLPQVELWIDGYLDRTKANTVTIASKKFERLSFYFSQLTLEKSKVVAVSRIEKPPLSQLGLLEFADFERMDVSGVTYKDTFFINPGLADDESLHFHELIHIVQWRVAGPEHFIMAYAAGLVKFGYRDSPLEVMAYDLQDRFDAGESIVDLEELIQTQTQAILTDPFRYP